MTLDNYEVARQIYALAFDDNEGFEDLGSPFYKIVPVYLNRVSGKIYQSRTPRKRDKYVFDDVMFRNWLDAMKADEIFDDMNPEETTDKERAIELLAEEIESQIGAEFELVTHSDLRRERKLAKKERNAEPYWKVLRDFRRSLYNYNWGINARAKNCERYFEHSIICLDDVKNDISNFYGVSVWDGLATAKKNGMKSRNKFYQLAKKLILESPSYKEFDEGYERADDDCKPYWATR